MTWTHADAPHGPDGQVVDVRDLPRALEGQLRPRRDRGPADHLAAVVREHSRGDRPAGQFPDVVATGRSDEFPVALGVDPVAEAPADGGGRVPGAEHGRDVVEPRPRRRLDLDAHPATLAPRRHGGRRVHRRGRPAGRRPPCAACPGSGPACAELLRAEHLRGTVAGCAAWYERQGPAADVLQVGDLPTPEPGPGEVRVRLRLSGVNPGDTEKRSGWLGNPMAFPRIVPDSDGAGGSGRRSARESTPHGSADGCGCGAPSPTGRRARRRSTPSSRPTPPWTCRTASATSSAPASASAGSPRTGRCSGTGRSPVASCSCTASSAGGLAGRPSGPLG